jgi:ABC-type dipeptide/oligopeptide/nickel transport system permease subunit
MYCYFQFVENIAGKKEIIVLRKKDSISPGKIVFSKFRKDKWGMAGLVFIMICFIIAVLGYQITPDKTPNADYESVEIALVKPFTSIKCLRIQKTQKIKTDFFTRLAFGSPSRYVDVPCKSYELKGKQIIVDHYIDFKNGTSLKVSLPYDESQRYLKTKYKFFVLGTDRFGRDLLSRLMIGTRITMMVGFIAVAISLFIGIILGAVAGYFRGWIDTIISWLMNVVWSIPTLLFVLTITISLGKGLLPVFVAVGLTMWVDVARIVRGEIFSVREKEFVVAGKALGFRSPRIIFKHILPNVMASVLVIASSNFASAILIESGLSFLGLGAQPPTPTWGNMIESHRNFIITKHAHLALIPGFAIMFLVLAFTMVSNGLKNAIEKR